MRNYVIIYSRHEPQRPLTHSRCLILLFYGFRNEGTINCDKNSIRNVGYSVKLDVVGCVYCRMRRPWKPSRRT
jgi:hypothetical protein